MTFKEKIEEIKKSTPIVEYLAKQGFFPVGPPRGNDVWYLSPLHKEKTASFHVNTAKNVWYDFGAGQGGDIINLHKELFGSYEDLLSKDIDDKKIAIGGGGSVNPVNTDDKKITINNVHSLKSAALFSYITSRGISSDTANKYCKEVHYTVNNRQYYAVGFPIDNDGWVLRNKYTKRCTAQEPTTIIGKENNGKCLVFEGFFDFMSYMELQRRGDFRHIGEVENIYVLNSVNTLARSELLMDEISSHKNVHCFLDNDKAGQTTSHNIAIATTAKSNNYHHEMPFSLQYNDLNEYLQIIDESKSKKAIFVKDLFEIKEKAEISGDFMLAPDGSRSDLSEIEWLFSRTQAFKQLFGDWEVVEKNKLYKYNNSVGDIPVISRIIDQATAETHADAKIDIKLQKFFEKAKSEKDKVKENLITVKGEPSPFIVNRIKTLLEKGFVEDFDFGIGGVQLSELQKRQIILGNEVLLKGVKDAKGKEKDLLLIYDAQNYGFTHRETEVVQKEKKETKKSIKL
jgi:hypothetical protein